MLSLFNSHQQRWWFTVFNYSHGTQTQMIRLFLNFYIGVFAILVVAWAIQTYEFEQRIHTEGIRIVEKIVGGSVRLSRNLIDETNDITSRDRTLAYINGLFDYKVQIVDADLAPNFANERFQQGDSVVALVVAGEEDLVFGTPLADDTQLLVFGPCPIGISAPSRLHLMTGLGTIMLVVAGAIALLLRPVALQMSAMEKAATAIAGGDLTTRVKVCDVPSASTLARALNTMANRVERLLLTQKELLQVVSHELRTPLSKIHFAIDLIRDTTDDAERSERLDSLERSTTQLDELVAELLQYVKFETGQIPLDVEDIPLLPLVVEIIEEQSFINPAIRFEVGAELRKSRPTLPADRHRLKRAIGNIVSNAGRFAASTVVIDATITDRTVRIHIDDDGTGIAEENQTRVFEPFFRCDESKGGAGLGLALVRRIIDRHGGSADCSKSPLGGARFQLTLPRDDTIPSAYRYN
jgi:two-component system sensor histidine kinase RstB